jgi:hypothetical protein
MNFLKERYSIRVPNGPRFSRRKASEAVSWKRMLGGLFLFFCYSQQFQEIIHLQSCLLQNMCQCRAFDWTMGRYRYLEHFAPYAFL